MIKRLFDICHAGIRTMFMWVCYRKTTLRIVSWSVLTTRLRIWYSYKRENEKHSSNKHTFCLLCMICVLLYTGHDVLWTYTCIYSYVGDCDKNKMCAHLHWTPSTEYFQSLRFEVNHHWSNKTTVFGVCWFAFIPKFVAVLVLMQCHISERVLPKNYIENWIRTHMNNDDDDAIWTYESFFAILLLQKLAISVLHHSAPKMNDRVICGDSQYFWFNFTTHWNNLLQNGHSSMETLKKMYTNIQ